MCSSLTQKQQDVKLTYRTFSNGRAGLKATPALIGQKMPLDMTSALSLARALSSLLTGNSMKTEEYDLLKTTFVHVVERKWQEQWMFFANMSFYKSFLFNLPS